MALNKMQVTFSNFAPFFVRFVLPNGEVQEHLRHDFIALPLLIEAVNKFAIEHYNVNGWDNIVECYSDAEIGEMITAKGARSIDAAIKACGRIGGIIEEQRNEALEAGGICVKCGSPDHFTSNHP